MKTHLKLKNRAICGMRKRVKPLKFVKEGEQPTCERCQRVVAT